MPSYINGVDASLITGLGQIGVTPPTVYPSGGLVVNSGQLRTGTQLINGYTYPTASFYNRPYSMDSASYGTSDWVKIVANIYSFYLLSSSGELFAMGRDSSAYTGTGKQSTLAKVTTGSNGWTDIAAGSQYAIGICDGKLFGIGVNTNGQFGRGNTTSQFTNFVVINNNTYWTKVVCGSIHSVAVSGSGGSGSLFFAGSNGSGRTGQNTTSGNTTTWTQGVGVVGSIFTDVSCGDDFTLAISGGNIYGTGENGNNTLGDGGTTDRLTMGLVSSAATYTKVFAFTDFSKAIDDNTYHYHTGNENYTRGDGSISTITTWTRLNTTGELATGWQNFYSFQASTQTYGVIGIKDYRPWMIGLRGSTIDWMPNTTWTNYTTTSPISTWFPFVSSSTNVSCSGAAFGIGFGGSVGDPILMINLTPSS